MRRWTICNGASALLLLATLAQAHKHAHEQLDILHRRHREDRVARKINQSEELEKRGGQCAFPSDAGLVAITPGSMNAGWAMSPDQACTPGSYCPYACPPGQVSMQWDPKATTYSYPQSMNGGLYCDSNGQISKPFPDKPYCQSTASNIGVVNSAGATVAFCQTVLPGNEAMLIPTSVDSFATLAVPDTSYWAGTAAHYYINPPGTSAGAACVWGSSSNPWGNWSPFVAGANQDASGQIYIKLGWNPIYLEQATPFRNQMPGWGVSIDCPNGGCSGLPCAISPSDAVNAMIGGSSSGAGGGNFCVVTVNKGSTANFVVSGGSGSASAWTAWGGQQGGPQGGQFYQSKAASSATSTKTSSTTTTTSSSTTASSTTTMSHTSSSRNSTMSYSSSDSISTTYSSQPTPRPQNQPYYNLFNTTAPQATVADTGADTGASATVSGPTASIAIATHTGDAATLTASLLSIVPLALWALL